MGRIREGGTAEGAGAGGCPGLVAAVRGDAEAGAVQES